MDYESSSDSNRSQLPSVNYRIVKPKTDFVRLKAEEVQQSISSRLEEQVRKYPNRLAVKTRTQEFTYDELNKAANRIARAILEQRGEGQETIAVLFGHDAPMIVAIFGVLKAGKIYVPLDPFLPCARIEYIMEDSQAGLILTNSKNQSLARELSGNSIQLMNIDDLDADISTENPGLSIPPEAFAYIIYTSGSTGEPKGVIENHLDVLHFTLTHTNSEHICRDDRIILLSSYFFSGSASYIYPALLNGATLFPFDIRKEGIENIAKWLIDNEITVYGSVSTIFRRVAATLTGAEDFQKLRLVLLGGERVHKSDVELYKRHFPPDCILRIGLGSSERKLSRCFFVDKDLEIMGNSIPVGYPVADVEVLLLDDNGNSVGFNRTGEIVIRSRYISPGYWRKPELTAKVFKPDPEDKDKRLYYTGDMGAMAPDGCLYYMGRKDLQVKIRGNRVEIGDVENALLELDNIKEAAVISRDGTSGNQLIAYLVPVAGSNFTVSMLRSALAKALPAYMIPSVFVMLDSLPVTPTGKLDRRNLPEPGTSRPNLGVSFVAPRTPIEKKLAEIWSSVLGLDEIGVYDNFFDLGGDSLLGTMITSRTLNAFGVKVSTRCLFQFPTISEMAVAIVQNMDKNAGDEDTKHLSPGLELSLCQEWEILRRKNSGPCPLSFAQQRLWFLYQLEPNNSVYNIPKAIYIEGRLDVAALQGALDHIVARHESLRTIFDLVDGTPVQVISESRSVDLPVIDLSKIPALEREAEAKRLLRMEAERPFDLSCDLMLRVALIKLDEQEHIFFLAMHHIASDGWSIEVLFQELAKFYRAFLDGKPSPLPDLPIQYADFAVWQRQWLQGQILDTQLSYWKRKLDGAPPILSLPTDCPRPSLQTYCGACKQIVLSPGLTNELKALSRRENVSIFMTLLAAFKALLYRYTGERDIVVGSPIAGRNRVEIEGLVGFFVNTLVLRTDFSGNPTFQELLRQTRATCLGAYSHQDLPFQKLVEELQPERNLRYSPMFQVMFIFQNTPGSALEIPGLQLSPMQIDSGKSMFDLTLSMTEESRGLQGTLEYNTDLFNAHTIERMLENLQTLLEGIAAEPGKRISDLPLLTQAERNRTLMEWNETQAAYPEDSCIQQLFGLQVERTPDALAVTFGEEQLTYWELNYRANQLAHYLQKRGIGAEVPVGICMDRSPEMIIGLLGILKAGAAYVPLDPSYPEERLDFMLEDAEISAVLTQRRMLKRLPNHGIEKICLDSDRDILARESTGNAPNTTTPEGLAYVIYTSGSTGKPKGVLGLHKGVMNRLNWMWETYPFKAGEVCCQKTSLSFVDSVWEIFGPLLKGIQVMIIPDEILSDPRRLVDTLATNQITRILLVPSFLHVLLNECADLQNQLPKLKYWSVSGEVLPLELARRFLDNIPQSILINLYGSTEVSADVTWYEMKKKEDLASSVPIGRPIFNTRIYILDPYLQPVPVGVPGQLHVDGIGLARGYLKRQELTGERFLPNPFSGESGVRLYKTGDLARWLSDGNIEFLGRMDHQIKLRGFRIELGEIESTLRQHSSVLDSVALVKTDGPNDKRLVAYVVLANHPKPNMRELRNFLKEKLPDYMAPAAFVILDALPLTPHGKVNRQALLAKNIPESDLRKASLPPRNALELELVKIWENVLKIHPIDVHDNFFDLGGHSLLAVYLLTHIEKAFGRRLPLISLFQSPTVAQLAQILKDEGCSPGWSALIPIRSEGSKYPFFCIQLAHGKWAHYLAEEQPVYGVNRYYGLRSLSEDAELSSVTRIENIAAHCLREIQMVQPTGPYLIGGIRCGDLVALEIAQQLQAQGAEIALLALFNPWSPKPGHRYFLHDLPYFASMPNYILKLVRELRRRQSVNISARIRKAMREIKVHMLGTDAHSSRSQELQMSYARGYSCYIPRSYSGQITIFDCNRSGIEEWLELATEGVDFQLVQGRPDTMFKEPNAQFLAEKLQDCLDKAQVDANVTLH